MIEMSIIDNITDKVTKTAKAAAKKSGNLVEITKLCVNVSLEEEKIAKAYEEIGKILYKRYLSNEEVLDDAKEQCEKIKLLNQNIKDMKDKILELKNVKLCSQCNEEIEFEFAYCAKCGAKQEEQSKVEIDFEKTQPTEKICSNCGNQSSPDMIFCCKCGTKLD